ncbi:MAG: hypothetical protein J5I52_07540 [Saprospiraceae bacterium]|nr:hypothetical protein [Saprospiraceae bacterium]
MSIAYNPYFFEFGQVIIKLCYVQKRDGLPDIEIFEATPEAREKEWSIYGAPDDDQHQFISFQNKDEIQEVQVKDTVYEIEFKKCEQVEYAYPKGAESVNVYHFGIRVKT